MTDKQIIIDDCIHLDEWKHCDICEKLIKTKDGANGKKREHLLTEEDLRCDFYPNCYYKQLKRKEQECEELKETIQLQNKMQMEVCEEKNTELDQLKQTLSEIKEIVIKTGRQEPPFDWGKVSDNLKQILHKIYEVEDDRT